MAAKFKQGDVVKLVAVTPEGPVEKFKMLDDGTILCLISWVDADGNLQHRWFAEDQLEKV
jgi:uncharacterized protein YodC (DUF2158 family)